MTEHKNIYEAINAVMQEVGYVTKTAPKPGQQGLNYSYAGEAALIEAIRPSMVAHGVIVYPAGVRDLITETYTTKNGAEMNHTIGYFSFVFAHMTSGTTITVEVLGEGADSGDKSANKAMTGAFKYALRQTFVIETGDDPDKYGSDNQERSEPAAKSNGKELPKHWIDDGKYRAAFWAYTKEMEMDKADVYAALNVESVHDFKGTPQDARKMIDEYLGIVQEPLIP